MQFFFILIDFWEIGQMDLNDCSYNISSFRRRRLSVCYVTTGIHLVTINDKIFRLYNLRTHKEKVFLSRIYRLVLKYLSNLILKNVS
jgi:hypothetical protein